MADDFAGESNPQKPYVFVTTATHFPQDSPQTPTTITGPQLFRTAQFSADGTSLITSSWDHTLSTYVLPQSLLQEGASCQYLVSHGNTKLQAPIRSLAPNPDFSLAEPSTQSVLVATNDHPIQLHHLFPHEPNQSKIASYKLINSQTEAYIAPNSLLWPSSRSVFLCGSTNRLDVFDLTREGEDGHYMTLQTIPHAQDPETGTSPVGSGIVQALWSPCGRYLALNERNSDGLIIYDIRQGSRLLKILGPRQASTQMRLGCDLFASTPEASGVGEFEVWGGTLDGIVKMWNNAGCSPDDAPLKARGWKAHDAPVTNTALHPSGSVIVTTAGTWGPPTESALDSKLGHRDRNGVPQIPHCNLTEDIGYLARYSFEDKVILWPFKKVPHVSIIQAHIPLLFGTQETLFGGLKILVDKAQWIRTTLNLA
ncbi:unnamed protein product [Parascedosporium putredinis]|uniref:Uncharacterized protein n=1 Tax=Parascedosporium putredinis TaxID=1442378 RepID=A0A9P1GUM3_9PEZI|nr:unnamed protein product [Parascedosporium putredinis]CAI7987952.1 unnamed protein product [Parascedosporium putredinis]